MRMGFAGNLAVLPDFLPEDSFRALVAEALTALAASQRVHIPQHKRGETVSYESLRRSAPRIVALYQSAELSKALTGVIGVHVMRTPVRDQSSCSLLIYDHQGDHIGWHYDHNFYNGRHFTVLLSLLNEHLAGPGLSSAKLLVRRDGQEDEIPTPANTLVVFEGVHICHSVSPLSDSERRIMLSMTFCTDSSTTPLKDLERRIKDTAYFGLRALRS
jgi:hypothetical protein